MCSIGISKNKKLPKSATYWVNENITFYLTFITKKNVPIWLWWKINDAQKSVKPLNLAKINYNFNYFS